MRQIHEGQPLEEVLFIRDEMANLAWAVERAVSGPAGRPLNRFEAWRKPAPPAPVGTLTYRLATEVPDYWVPFVPVHPGAPSAGTPASYRSVVFERRAVTPPLGRLLEPERPKMTINEEEVPRSGAVVTRAYRYARWTDGSTRLWVGRRKRPGQGEGSSGLRFDVVGPV